VFPQRLFRSILSFTQAIQDEIRVHQIAVIYSRLRLQAQAFPGLRQSFFVLPEVIVDVSQVEMRPQNRAGMSGQMSSYTSRAFSRSPVTSQVVPRFEPELFSFAPVLAKFIGFLGVRCREPAFS
jgi:hypothetical protein